MDKGTYKIIYITLLILINYKIINLKILKQV